MRNLKLSLAAVALVLTLAVPVVANAAPQRVPATVSTRTGGVGPLQWLADNIALTKINLSPGAKRFVNSLIKSATPILCPLVAKLADPSLQSFVKQACLDIGASADPWGSLKNFVPILCNNPGAIFPKYAQLFTVACGFLV